MALIIVAVFLLGRRFGAGAALKQMLDWVSSLGAIAPLVFILIYILACVLFLPGSILTIGSGALFGLLWGSIYASIGATVGAICAFLVGRYVAREWVARKLERFPKFKAIDAAVGHEGWKIVALTRLSPIFPFNLLNYAFGLTRVSLRDYAVASWAGMLPGTVMYVYLGSVAGDLTVASGGMTRRTPAWWAINIIGLLATIAVALYAAHIARKALSQQTLAPPPNNGVGQPAHHHPTGSA
ncbi:MAG: TVP38/TMEM64 family protein [Candidatus Binataceae bacterium]